MKSAIRLFSPRPLPTVGLRVKLVMSYLLVALGTILILTLAVSLAGKNYLVNAQIAGLHQEAAYQAQQLQQLPGTGQPSDYYRWPHCCPPRHPLQFPVSTSLHPTLGSADRCCREDETWSLY